MRFTWIVVVLAAMGTWSWAQAAGPTTGPASRPAGMQARIDRLLKQLGADDWQVRQKTQDELVTMGEDVLPDLQKLRATTADEEVRTRAEAAIRLILPASDANELLKRALTDDPAMARKAVQAMAKLARGEQYEATMPKLKRVVEGQKDATVRAQVAVELSDIIKTKKLIAPPEVLIKLCKDQSPEVRTKAFVALSNIKAEDAVRPLVDGLHDPDVNVRIAAFQAWVELIGGGHFEYHPVDNPDPEYPRGTIEQWEEYVRVVCQRMRDRGM